MVFKQNLTAPKVGGSAKGSIVKHKGKGSQMAPSVNRDQISQLARNPASGINDYAKATPMAGPSDGDSVGLGSGSFPGIAG